MQSLKKIKINKKNKENWNTKNKKGSFKLE